MAENAIPSDHYVLCLCLSLYFILLLSAWALCIPMYTVVCSECSEEAQPLHGYAFSAHASSCKHSVHSCFMFCICLCICPHAYIHLFPYSSVQLKLLCSSFVWLLPQPVVRPSGGHSEATDLEVVATVSSSHSDQERFLCPLGSPAH